MIRRLLTAAALAVLTLIAIGIVSFLSYPSDADAVPSGDKQTQAWPQVFTKWLALVPDAQNVTPAAGTGSLLDTDTATLTDTATAASGTATSFGAYSFIAPTLAATNSSVTTTDATTLYVNAAPTAGTNQTFTRSFAVWVDAGKVKFDGDFEVDGATQFDGSGGLVLSNSESVSNGTDGTITFGRNDAGNMTLTAKDDDATAALTILPGGAAAFTLGGASTTALTVTTDGTGTGEVVLPTDAIAAGEITDITRSIPLPLGGWVPCAGTVAGVWDASGVDTEPDLVAVNTALTVEYDATGGSVDADEICTSFTVPQDYASGGSFAFRFTQAGATGANVEDWDCRLSVDGAAIGAASSAALANQTAVQTVTLTPAGTWAAAASIGIACKQSDAAADDTIRLHSAEGRYTATQ